MLVLFSLLCCFHDCESACTHFTSGLPAVSDQRRSVLHDHGTDHRARRLRLHAEAGQGFRRENLLLLRETGQRAAERGARRCSGRGLNKRKPWTVAGSLLREIPKSGVNFLKVQRQSEKHPSRRIHQIFSIAVSDGIARRTENHRISSSGGSSRCSDTYFPLFFRCFTHSVRRYSI